VGEAEQRVDKSLTFCASTAKNLMHLSEIAALLTQPKVVKVARSARTKIKQGIGVTLRGESKASLMCGVLYLSVVKNRARDLASAAKSRKASILLLHSVLSCRKAFQPLSSVCTKFSHAVLVMEFSSHSNSTCLTLSLVAAQDATEFETERKGENKNGVDLLRR
jgi:hypothetical protein